MNSSSTENIKSILAKKMKEDGVTAIIWSNAFFNATGMPLVADASGKSHVVYGLALSPSRLVAAIVSVPEGMTLHGLLVIDSSMRNTMSGTFSLTDDGTAAEWSVLTDCYNSAMEMHRAQLKHAQPMPWW